MKSAKKKSIFLRIALLAFSVYVVVTLVQLQLEIRDRREELSTKASEIERQRRVNEDLENKNQNTDEALDQQARETGKPAPVSRYIRRYQAIDRKNRGKTSVYAAGSWSDFRG